MEIDGREIFGIISVVLVFLAYSPLIIATVRDQVKPHPITWLVQALVKGTGGLILTFNGAHAGAWGMLLGAAFCLVVAVVSFFGYRKVARISRKDFLFLLLALTALFLWLFSRDLAVISVILLAITSILGFVPTFSKTWQHPHSESYYSWILFSMIGIAGILATDNPDFVNLLSRVTGLFINFALILIMIFKRKQKRDRRKRKTSKRKK